MEAIRIVDVGFDSSLCEMLGSYRGVPTSIRHGLRGYLTTVTMYNKGNHTSIHPTKNYSDEKKGLH